MIHFQNIFDHSKPNRLLLYLRILHCLVFGDKFFINLSKLEDAKTQEWKINMIINDGIPILLNSIEKIIHSLSEPQSYSKAFTYIQCLQLFSKWIHFFTFSTATSLSYNKEALSSILKQVIHNRPQGIVIGVPKEVQSSAQPAPQSADKQINSNSLAEYENIFEEEVSNNFYVKLIVSNFHSTVLQFIQNTTKEDFKQFNFTNETETVYINLIEILIVLNEVNPESFKETVQWEYDKSVIMNLIFVEKSKNVRKVVENFFIIQSQYLKSIDIKTKTKAIRDIVNNHILNIYKRIYLGQV